VWNVLQAAYTKAGFDVECAGVLDKTQGSFKQVTAPGAVRGDPVLLLRKHVPDSGHVVENVWNIAEKLRKQAASNLDPVEQSPQRLYSRLVMHYLGHHQQVPINAERFYRWHAEQDPSEKSDVARS
jgi:hypothetical protein